MTERVHPDSLPSRPIDQLRDMVPPSFTAYVPPSEPLALLNTMLNETVAATDRTTASSDLIRHLASCQAIRACIQAEVQPATPDLLSNASPLPTLAGQTSVIPRQQTELARSVSEQAASLSPGEAVRYMLDQMEGFTHYLATGERLTDWPHAAVYGEPLTQKSIADLQRMSAIVRHAIEPLQRYDHAVASDLTYRYCTWLVDICDLLFSRKLIGTAIPLINTATERVGPFMLYRLRQVMEEVREEQGGQAYRRIYSQTYHALMEPWRSAFVRSIPRLPAELIPGSQREVIQWPSSVVLVERFAAEQAHSAQLASGQSVELPYTVYHERTFGEYDTPAETEHLALQQRVAYKELDVSMQQAIARAVRLYAHGTPSMSVPAHYARLALRKQASGDATLHTVRFRPGIQRSTSMYPDDGARRRHPAHHTLESQVMAAEYVSDNYLVVPYRGGNPAQATFGDKDPNFFGPGADRANAFWIAGAPRIVVDASGHPDRMRADFKPQMRTTPRWVIMPVRYFRIASPDTRQVVAAGTP